MKRGGTNPFKILGVSPSAPKEAIQKAFTKLALKHHPDTSKPQSSLTNSSEQFIRIRRAYESIRDGAYPSQNDKRTNATSWKNEPRQRSVFSEKEFLDHLYRQTGTRITSAQRRELIQLDSSRIPGATYNGPGWDFARRVAIEQELFIRNRNEYYASNDKAEGKHKDENQSDGLRRRRQR